MTFVHGPSHFIIQQIASMAIYDTVDWHRPLRLCQNEASYTCTLIFIQMQLIFTWNTTTNFKKEVKGNSEKASNWRCVYAL